MIQHASPPPHDKRDYAARMRPFADLFCLWRLCSKLACTRARACRGDARVCFPRHGALLPDGVLDWYERLCDAQKRGVPFDDAMEELYDTDADGAFRDWYASVAVSLGEQPAELPWRWWK